MKKHLIEVRTEVYSYTTKGGYDDIHTHRTERSIVKILDIERTFDDDSYLYKATAFINKTFAEDKLYAINSEIARHETKMKQLKNEVDLLKKKKSKFLVPVKVLK